MTPLERLIGACADDERLLEYGELLDGARRTALRRLSKQRAISINELTEAGRTLHRTPRKRRSWLGALRSLLIDLRFFVGGPNAGDVIHACLRSQDHLQACFAEAIRVHGWAAPVRQVLEEQHERIRSARGTLNTLR